MTFPAQACEFTGKGKQPGFKRNPDHGLAGFLLLLLMSMSAVQLHSQGRVVFEGQVESLVLGTNRMVRVYLPPSYEQFPRKRFPVLYVHDGQNAFTTAGDHVAFGWGNWAIDKSVTELSRAGRMQEIIVVAVDCSSQRYLDYRGPAYPYSAEELGALKRRPSAPGDDSRFDRHARFLIEELKPKIDRDYRTKRDRANTAVMGSSMGGICSIALAWQRPDVFGKAASLSGAFQVEKQHFLRTVLGRHSGKPKRFKAYIDSGVVDYSGGDDDCALNRSVAVELRRLGWKDGRDLLHYVDEHPLGEPELEKLGLRRNKWAEAQTSQHNEFYWRVRTPRALMFLFPAK
ncbi:MAG: alpha/beta hydrolase [Pedosphaera sp.]|nr:alpha/beta hydrolase [Pedosphaera sp.]